jgi:hypothetical protein
MRTSLLSHRKKAVQWSRRRSNGGPDQNIVLASFRYFDTTRFDDVMSLKTPVYVDIAPVRGVYRNLPKVTVSCG